MEPEIYCRICGEAIVRNRFRPRYVLDKEKKFERGPWVHETSEKDHRARPGRQGPTVEEAEANEEQMLENLAAEDLPKELDDGTL